MSPSCRVYIYFIRYLPRAPSSSDHCYQSSWLSDQHFPSETSFLISPLAGKEGLGIKFSGIELFTFHSDELLEAALATVSFSAFAAFTI